MTPDDLAPDDMARDDVSPDDVSPDDVARDGVARDGVAPDDVAPGPVTVGAADRSTGERPTTEPATPEQAEAAPALARRRGSVVARTLSALGVLALTAGVVGAGTVRPPLVPVEVPPTQVHVPAPTTRLVCPGPLRLATEPEPGGDVAYDPQFDPAPGESTAVLRAVTAAPTAAGAQGDENLTEDAATGDLRPLGVPDEVLAELQGGTVAGVAELGELGRSVVVGADPTGDAPAWVAGAIGVTTPQGDLRGLAAASCQEPATDTWLVGGSTELGSSARLVLQNPGLTAATVQVELWGPAGPVELAGSPEFLVPAGSERAVLLEGVAAEQKRIVVHVAASGGLVAAYLQDSRLRGLVPAGVDLVVAGQAPAGRQVVTDLTVTASVADGSDLAMLRILAPQEAGAAHVTFLGPDGVVALPGTDTVALEAGAVLDVPLGGLPAGDYTAVVDADVPVVTGALVTRGAVAGLAATTPGQAPVDRAWAPSVALGASGALALPADVRGRLLVGTVEDPAVDGAAAVRLEIFGADGELLGRRDLRLLEGRTLSLAFETLLTAGTAAGDDAGDDAADEPAGTTAASPEVAAVVLRTTDPRVAWGAFLAPQASSVPGDVFVSVLTPVAPVAHRTEVGVLLR